MITADMPLNSNSSTFVESAPAAAFSAASCTAETLSKVGFFAVTCENTSTAGTRAS